MNHPLEPIRHPDELLSIFSSAEKPASHYRIGAEAEKFGVHAETGAPLKYDGEHGVARVLEALQEHAWLPERESPEGPLIALRRGAASITLEPGSQLELSGATLVDVHEVRREMEEHVAELEPVSRRMNLAWLGVGFHPIARQRDLDWVPKQRYGIMSEYLPPRGSGAHDMMRRTATVQVNLDFSSEEDALKKLCTALLLSPLVNAMTANSPFEERRRSRYLSRRGHVWQHMDPERSGLIEGVLRSKKPSYRDYVEWALDAGMFLFKRGSRVVANGGQTFRDFLANGFEGERATLADWKLHLNTLFPEVRLKNTIEIRGCDSLPLDLAPAVPALFVGLLYDETALGRAYDLAQTIRLDALFAARSELVEHGLAAKLGSHSARSLAERVLEIAEGGLGRRARRDGEGRDERIHLAPLAELVANGKSPANRLLDGLSDDAPVPVSELIARTRFDA